MSRLVTSVLMGFIIASISSLAFSSALASHYRLPADGLVTAEERKQLNGQGVDTTLALLHRTAKVREREALARNTGLSFARLTSLACQVDLLRVRGLGPSMVKLLQTGGIRHTRDLRRANIDDLQRRLRTANAIHHIAPVLPRRGVLDHWIAQAKGLKQLLEGVQ